ncbi:DUF4259 domain-containing protein [Aquimarina sp. BL5]|nr:DUF4259 domain-containing protein [Aquimarina sp. BL5]AXT53183.1 DUF4259 domain-containing protein [Aquimarina sp. BL5]RKM96901.1 DUF4259 domain-containing protein [Aquimarina sp. BL5]
MGAWGTGILQNDTTADIWAEYKHLYNLSHSVTEIRKKLENEYNPDNDEDEYADFWTGIAHSQWMCGELEPESILKVKECIETGKGLSLWKENEKDYKKRIKTLTEFIEKIQKPKEKPLKRKKITLCPAYFTKGDIVSIQLESKQFIFALAFEQENDEIDGGNRFVFSSLISDSLISVEEFLNSEIMYLDNGGDHNYHQGYFWSQFQARNMKRKIKRTKVIGKITFDDYLGFSNSVPFGDWNNISDLYSEQIKFQKSNNTRKPFKISIKDFIQGENKEFELKLLKHANELWREQLKKINAT